MKKKLPLNLSARCNLVGPKAVRVIYSLQNVERVVDALLGWKRCEIRQISWREENDVKMGGRVVRGGEFCTTIGAPPRLCANKKVKNKNKKRKC